MPENSAVVQWTTCIQASFEHADCLIFRLLLKLRNVASTVCHILVTHSYQSLKCRSGSVSALPIVLEATIEVGASESEDGVGAADSPEHTGLFEA